MKRSLFCSWVLVGFFIPQAWAVDFPPVQSIRLPNGMKFLLVERGEAPIFTAVIRFGVGGADEEAGKTGLAHFAEHMAFKGTEKLSEVELTRRVEEEGGEGYNATTSKDMTTYVVSFPSDRLQFWAETEAERIFKPVLRGFESERNVVLEERRMRVQDDPEGRFYEQWIQKGFEGTPYEWPAIGWEQDLTRLTQADLEEFYKNYYRPSNAVGVVVGRFSLKEAEKILLKTFGKVPNGNPKKPVHWDREPRPADLRRPEKGPVRIYLAFSKPTLPDRADYIFDLIERILGGRSSRLYRSLVLEKKLVSGIRTYNGIPGVRGPNLFLIHLVLLPGADPETVLNQVDEILKKFSREGPTEEEMERATNQILVQQISNLKTNEGLADLLSYFEIAAGSWKYLQNYLEVLGGITPQEVRQVASEYLDRSRSILGVMGR